MSQRQTPLLFGDTEEIQCNAGFDCPLMIRSQQLELDIVCFGEHLNSLRCLSLTKVCSSNTSIRGGHVYVVLADEGDPDLESFREHFERLFVPAHVGKDVARITVPHGHQECAIHNVPVCGCVGVCTFLVQTVSAFTSVAGYAGPVNIEVGHTDSCSSWTAGSAAVGQLPLCHTKVEPLGHPASACRPRQHHTPGHAHPVNDISVALPCFVLLNTVLTPTPGR